MIKINPVEDKQIWEDFVIRQKPSIFLQSWNWGVFCQNLGQKVFRLGFWQGNQLCGVALVIKEKAKRGTFLACPGGPLIDWSNKSSFELFSREINRLGKTEGAFFVRVRPSIIESEENRKLFTGYGFVPAPMHMHAETTWQLDLEPDEAALLASMRKNTRYAIRKAEKDGVRVKISRNSQDLDLLYKLQLQTSRRHRFVPFSREYLRAQFKVFHRDDQVLLLLAEYKNICLAASMIIYYGDTAVYHYSGSRSDFPKISASAAIQWQAIKEAKKRGCRYYNFWGIAPNDNPRHRFAGVTTFKKGFGGQEISYLHAHDLPLRKSYWLIHAFEAWRRISRRL